MVITNFESIIKTIKRLQYRGYNIEVFQSPGMSIHEFRIEGTDIERFGFRSILCNIDYLIESSNL